MNELNIVIPIRCCHAVRELADGERGRLMLGIVNYCVEGREPGFTGGEKYLWPEFKAAIDERKRARAEAGRLGGLAKASNASNATNAPPSSPLEPPINPPKEILSKESTKKSPPARPFIPPVLEEVRLYCRQRNNNVDAQAFIDFYESKGWLVGRTKMKDWKAAVRTWERYSFGKEQPPTESPKKWDNTHRFVPTGEFEGYWEDFIDGKWVRVD